MYVKILKAVNLINFNSTVLLRLRIINNQSYCYFYSNIYFCISYICMVILYYVVKLRKLQLTFTISRFVHSFLYIKTEMLLGNKYV